MADGQRADARRADIQGLRALAVLFVVAFHAGLPAAGGFVGVDVFFVISGFVITGMLMREHAAHGRIRFGRFYLRRFKRLTPALAVVVAVTMLVSALALSPIGGQAAAAQTGLGAMLLVANIVIARSTGDYFSRSAETNPLLNTWSLSVEEQFYLVFPLLLGLSWLFARCRPRLRWLPVAVVSVIAVLSFAATAWDAHQWQSLAGHLSAMFGFYGAGARAWEFAAGALLAFAVARWPLRSARAGLVIGMVGGAAMVSSLWLITGETQFPGAWTLLPVLGTVLLLLAGSGNLNPVSRVLSSAPMVALGDWSYSIYLWHWPFIVFAKVFWPHDPVAVLVASAVSFVPAYASYCWIEQPIRTMTLPTRTMVVKLIAAVLIPPVLLAGGVGFASQQGFWSQTVRDFRGVATHHVGVLTGCSHESWLGLERCRRNATAVGSPVYLVGDSNADQFSEAVAGAAEQLGRPMQPLTEDGCMFLDASPVYPGASYQDACDAYRRGVSGFLDAATPGTVVLSHTDVYWLTDSMAIGLDRAGATKDPAAKLAVLPVALGRTIDRLRAAGHRVLVVQTRTSLGRFRK